MYFELNLVSQFSHGSSLTWSEREPLNLVEQVLYGLDVPPVTQPSVSKHWREHIALTSISGQTSSFLHPPPDSWRNGFCSL